MRRISYCLYQGKQMASKAEVQFAMALDVERIKWIYEPESFEWVPPLRKYTPDFKIERLDRSVFYVEFKGYLRFEDKLKLRMIKKQYPALDLRIVFQKANKPLYKGSKSTYGDWATKMGFPWAEGRIPKAWLNEKVTKKTYNMVGRRK